MTRVDLDPVRELQQPLERGVESRCTFDAADRQVGSRRVTYEERVAGENEPRLVGPCVVDDRKAAVLGAVSWSVETAEGDVANGDVVAVDQRVVGILDAGGRMDADRDPVPERQSTVTRDVVGVGVRFERSDDADLTPRGLREELFDSVGRVDDYRLPCSLAANEI